jgi:hypothetical protein
MTEEQKKDIKDLFEAMSSTGERFVIGQVIGTQNNFFGQEPTAKPQISDAQMADAISSINGKGKVLDEYQNWLGVCCYVSARCGYPMDLKMCCERLKQLPYRNPLYREVKYENIRAFTNWNFVKAGYDQWPTMKVNDQERTLYVKCRDTAMALENALMDTVR